MASYYYLIASLPELKADGEMPITYSEFLSCCQSNVSESKYKLLEDLSLSSVEGPLVNKWAEFYGMLTKELNYQRRSCWSMSLKISIHWLDCICLTTMCCSVMRSN
jgi:hypothetical protein